VRISDRWKTDIYLNPPVGWQMQFAHLGADYTVKVTCIICGTQGYANGGRPNGWQVSCLEGHPEQCEGCGARFGKGGLSKHLNCRSGHKDCCACHTDTQYRRMQRRLEMTL